MKNTVVVHSRKERGYKELSATKGLVIGDEWVSSEAVEAGSKWLDGRRKALGLHVPSVGPDGSVSRLILLSV
ncbi:unnamed protein product [Nippostrongylus brasiliensis]|uniref:DUF2188 domain-containing protein n=1 Tax=Nippostrongylus brasiliensis TaxID=27835 RepID=A0A0N4XJS4_NIPBR|nr:unnamed protein product [Nippostrongylus brasiliensis]